jgi:hypothetical protein
VPSLFAVDDNDDFLIIAEGPSKNFVDVRMRNP